MTNQVTSIEQSKRLLELGVPAEMASMVWDTISLASHPILREWDTSTDTKRWQGDLFTYWQTLPEGQLDLIVSNPPYLTSAEMGALQPEVAQEPAMALEAGEDGLVFYRAIAEHYQKALRSGGALALEIGWQQREAVTALLAANGWTDIACRKDFGGNDRCVMARKQ